MKYTVITGVSSGICYATAKSFTRENHNLILIARNQLKLVELSNEILKENPNLNI